MQELIWSAIPWRGHLALLVCVVTAYVALRCLWATRRAHGKQRRRLLFCGLAAATLAPVATAPTLGILPVLVAGGLVFLAATGATRNLTIGRSLTFVGMSLLVLPTAILASGNVVSLGSGPSMWPTVSKGFSLMIVHPGQEYLGRGSQIDFQVPMDEAGQDPDTQWPAGRYHKRVIGLPGDHVVMDDYTIRVNDQLVADCKPTKNTHHLKLQTWICNGQLPRGNEWIRYQMTWGEPEIWMDGRREWSLGAGEALVFGDNLVESGDSRHRGVISTGWITGTVVNH